MKIAFYIGDHSQDSFSEQAGYWLIKLMQKGPYGDITHVEAIHAEHEDGSVTIASSSLRDNGVRAKVVKLNPLHWIIVDVPSWDVALSIAHLATTLGHKYDIRGAIATVFLGSQDNDRDFCNEWVATPFLKASSTFSPSQFAAICLSIGQDVTEEFFANRPLE